MVVDIYTQRQAIIQNNQSRHKQCYKMRAGQRVTAAREVMLGIEPTTFVYADGTKVNNTKYTKAHIQQARQRHTLTPTNSQILRPPGATSNLTTNTHVTIQPTTAPAHPPPNTINSLAMPTATASTEDSTRNMMTSASDSQPLPTQTPIHHQSGSTVLTSTPNTRPHSPHNIHPTIQTANPNSSTTTSLTHTNGVNVHITPPSPLLTVFACATNHHTNHHT